jgi:hypothetical protein
MPRWDGEKAAGFMRQHTPDSKIIAFSAVLGDSPEWADEFLVKSDITQLVPLVEQMLAMA